MFLSVTEAQTPPAAPRTMPDFALCLEALSVLSGCNVEATDGASQLSPQDFVNVVALKEFYKQRGLKELEYPSIGTLSLHELDEQDLYSAPPMLKEGPDTAGPEPSLRTTVKINPQDFFHPQYDYDFTNIKVSSPGGHLRVTWGSPDGQGGVRGLHTEPSNALYPPLIWRLTVNRWSM